MKKQAYLTIDDTPSKDFKKKIDYLLKKKIPTVLFCEGQLLKKRPKDAIYAIRKGFIIANHACSHKAFSDILLEECLEEIKKTEELIEKLYKKVGIKRPAKFFRFPHGDKGGNKSRKDYENEVPYDKQGEIKKQKIQDFLKKLGYTKPKIKITYNWYKSYLNDVDWLWTYDVLEWTTYKDKPLFGINSLQKVFERMEEDVPEEGRGLNYPGSEEIILIHDHEQTTEMFKPIINRLLEKGVEFKEIKLK